MSDRSSNTGASHLVAALIEAGVERLFSLSGNQILSVYDACLDAGLEIIHVRHEAAAVHMADAWGRLSGRPGVALLTADPGHANGLSALFVARQSESPLVVLSGQSARADDGRGAFQEMPQAELAHPLAKAAWTAEDPRSLGGDVRRALDLAVHGRPGPVAVSLPSDMLEAEAPRSNDAFANPEIPTLTEADRRHIRELLDAAQRPMILAGPAMMRPPASVDLEQLEATTGVPVVATESPRGVNDPSLRAFAEVLAQADAVLLLGKRLDHSLQFGAPPFFAAGACLAQIDADSAELDRTRRNVRPPQRLAIAAQAHPGQAARQLAAVAQSARRDRWRGAVRSAVAYRPAAWDAWQSPPDGPLHPIELCQSIRPRVEDGIVVMDGGEFGQWAQALLSGRRRVINGPAGSIGTSIPFALAARLLDRDAPIVALQGDGAVGFHLLEFDTAVRHNLPFVAIVGNDAGWNAERRLQARTYGEDRIFACDLLPTRYDLVAALGGHGEHVTKRSDLDAALDRAFASGLPSLVNVAIEPAEAPIVRRNGAPARAGH